MNRRLRIAFRSSTKRDDRFQKYLKPGALAQLRDSKMSARSQKPDPHTTISVLRSISSSPTRDIIPAQIDGLPCFAARIYGPRFPQRKKLAAPKSFFIIPSSPVLDSPDSLLDVFNSDILVAH